MKKNIQIFHNGLFDKPFMQTRIKTHSMTFKEKLLGYFLGPAGMIVFFAMLVELRELFYTSVVPVDRLFGTGVYLLITTVSTIVGVLFGWMLEHTNCKAGKIRPYILIGSFIMLVSGVAQFCIPFANGTTGQLIWLFAANVIYNGIGIVMFNYRYQKIGLATRNLKDRATVTTVYNGADSILSGVIVGLLVSSVLYYQLLIHDTTGENWRMLVLISAAAAIPLVFVEYFYSRERVIEENNDALIDKTGTISTIPLAQQAKALLTNKYFLLAMAISIINKASGYMQGTNVRTNYCQWVLGATAENNLQIMYMSIAMAPMGFGILLLFPLVKKIGARKVVMLGAAISAIAGTACMLAPQNPAMAFGGSFIYNFGNLALAYLSITFLQQANDMVEYQYNFRPEGTRLGSIILILYTVFLTPLTGLYETVLVALGYDAYSTVGQNPSVINWIVFVWFGSVVIQAVVTFIALIFFDAEKKIDKVQAELKERRKQAVLARGEEWVDEEEQERLAKEASARIAEEDRIKDLKERCAKKGLDFDAENQKYLAKQAKKAAKKQKKEQV